MIRSRDTATVGFIGLGLMGSAMAANLQKATPLTVWNRTTSACEPLAAAGAHTASSAAEVLEECRIVFVMLSDEAAVDDVLRFDDSVPLRNRVVVLMSTVSPRYSADLARRIEGAGGAYVEAPVSGSRGPAVDARLVSMLAGEDTVLDEVEPLIRAMSSTVFRCGQVPSALTMKLAVNIFLITQVTGLAEAFHFAESNGVDPQKLRMIVDAGPMASTVSQAKTAKIVTDDWAPHAAISDVLKNCLLISDHARDSSAASPLMEVCTELYARTELLGHAGDDMAAVIFALRDGGRYSQ